MEWYLILLIVLGALVAAAACFAAGFLYRKKVAEREIGSAETEATRLINEAIRAGENRKKEMLLEAKDEIHKSRTEYEKEVKERRAELSKQERRLEQKESTLDKKTETYERKEEELNRRLQKVTETQNQAEAIRQQQLEKLEEISGGNITVECYDSGTLYGQDTEHDALKNGDVDMIYSSASWLTDGSPWVSMFTAGYVFQSYDHMTRVLNGNIGKEMFQKIADEQGILPLGAYYLGTREISLSQDKAIKTPDDLKGVNLRMPNSDAWVFLGKAMGANPTAIGFNDLYLALQTGTVDGQDNPLPTVKSAKFYEVQKSISLTNHLVDSVWPTINLNTWNKLTDTQKGWVMEAVEAGREACDSQNLKTESEVQDFLKEQGLTIYEADVAAFADHVLDAYLNDPISGSWDKDLLEQIKAMA